MTTLYKNAAPPSVRLTMVRESGKKGKPGPRVSSPEAARAIAHQLLADEPQEVFIVLMLDTKHRVIATHEVSRGSLDGTMVHPREVFRAAVMLPCAGIILAHNHPSGDPTPSVEDRAVTKRLEEAGKVLGIPVVDHIVVGNGRTWSMTDNVETIFPE